MHKGLAVLSVALTVAVMGVSAAACEDPAPSAFPEGEQEASFDTGPGFNTDGTAPSDATPKVDCNPALPTTFKAVWKPPATKPVPAACPPDDLAGYYDACLKTPADVGPCKTWRDAHATCTACIEPADGTGPIQWYLERYYFTVNIAGCLSIESNEPEDGKCPALYDNAIQCQRASCTSCLPTQGAKFADFQQCQKEAKASACKGYADKVATGCNEPDASTTACYPQGAEGQRAHFMRVEGIFCGGP